MQITLRDDFDIQTAIADLDGVGGTSFPLLSDDVREYLVTQARGYRYKRRKKVVGPAQVRQDFSAVDTFPDGSPFLVLRDRWEQLLTQKLLEVPGHEALFSVPLHFNDTPLQLYKAGSEGITPHMDGASRINLICVVMLIGECRFCICEDRDGTNPIDIDASPGRIVMLRAPGYRGSEFRPYHFVTAIPTLRISFGLRQKGQFP